MALPRAWREVPEDGALPRFEGDSGFLSLDKLRAPSFSLHAACASDAAHPLQPYGLHPSIARLTVDGSSACLIIPSADQASEMDAAAEVLTTDRQPDEYQFLIVVADEAHIRRIAESIRFIEQA